MQKNYTHDGVEHRQEKTINRRKHAIVIGGSFAGLVVARVLADFFDLVTIIERDKEKNDGDFSPRAFVPQGNHTHFMKCKASSILMELFPDLGQKLISAGAYKIDIINDVKYYLRGRKINFKSDKYTYLQSRAVLEECIRSLVSKYPNIRFQYETVTQKLLKNENCITGVRILDKKTQQESESHADLIVDASGKATRFPEWLQDLGYPAIEKEEWNVDMCYVTRIYRISPHYQEHYKSIVILPLYDHMKSAVLHVIEDDSTGKRWIVSLIGTGEVPPDNEEGFLDYAQKLAYPDIYEAIKNAEALTDPVRFKFPKIQRYHYEKNNQIPEGFISVGDALCALNPRYGLGLTISTCEAQLVQNLLSNNKALNLTEIQKEYFSGASSIIDIPWNYFEMSFIRDNCDTILHPSWKSSLVNQIKNVALQACNHNAKIWEYLFEIYTLERKPSLFIAPNLLLPLLIHGFKKSAP